MRRGLAALTVGLLWAAPLSTSWAQQPSLEARVARMERLLDNQALVELVQRVEELQSELRDLRGLIEQQGYEIEGIKKRQRELYLDVDRRIRDLEVGGVPAPAAAAGAASAAGTAGAATAPPANPREPTTTVSAPPPAPTVGSPEITQAERNAYQQAFELLKEGRYREAITMFESFLATYPNGSYSDNAQYWLGEANYVLRQFEPALAEFNKVITNFPRSTKVPDAMLKLGYTQYELKQYADARATLERLLSAYPEATVSRLAEKRLERMGKEGH
jgi:tol-pal system protein YbgF